MKADNYYFCPKCFTLGCWDDFCSECGIKKVGVFEVNGIKVNSAEPVVP